jgi:hypothetical protein
LRAPLTIVAAVLACTAVLAGCGGSNQSENNGAGHSPPANVAPGVASSENPPVQDPASWIGGINTANTKQTVKFDPNPKQPSYLVSHAQGYARYRGAGYDYHIVSYSNVAGRYGYVYIASNGTHPNGKSLHAFTLQVPAQQIQFQAVSGKKSVYNPHFNHPGGIQVIGDYLAVPVIPYNTKNGQFYDAAIIYLYNLSSLKGPNPQKPSQYKEILRVPRTNGGSLQSVGIARLPNGEFCLGLVTQNNLDMYTTSNTPSNLWDANWRTSPDISFRLSHKYQTNGLFLDQTGNLWMVGFRDANIVDLYQLRFHTGGGHGGWVPNNATLMPTGVSNVLTTNGAKFRAGGGIEIVDPSQIWLYAVGMYYGGGGVTINYWR